MKILPKNRKILVITILCLLVLLEIVYLNKGSLNQTQEKGLLLDELLKVDTWESAIDKKGANSAYAFFKKEVGGLDFSVQHLAAHHFGDALFNKQGVEGVVVCDNEFAFGCYHQFFLSAIGQHGLTIIKELDEACIEKYTVGGLGCQHGIGHGLMEYFGHEGLEHALEACATLKWQEPFLGCQDGVFMEYNFPTIIGKDTASVGIREFDADNIEFPCKDIGERFQQACFFAQPNWIMVDWDDSLQEAANMCAGLDNKNNRKACFKGMGDSFGERSGGDIGKAVEGCDEASLRGSEGNVLCRAGVYWSYWKMDQYGGYRSLAQKACEGLAEGEYAACENEADITGKFFKDHEQQ